MCAIEETGDRSPIRFFVRAKIEPQAADNGVYWLTLFNELPDVPKYKYRFTVSEETPGVTITFYTNTCSYDQVEKEIAAVQRILSRLMSETMRISKTMDAVNEVRHEQKG